MPAKRRFAIHSLPTALSIGVLGGCAVAAVAPPGELRILVQFARSVDPSDPALLQRLTAAAGTSVSLSSLVSDTEAAYWLKCTARDANCFAIMGRLSLEPLIISLQPDRYRYPADPPR